MVRAFAGHARECWWRGLCAHTPLASGLEIVNQTLPRCPLGASTLGKGRHGARSLRALHSKLRRHQILSHRPDHWAAYSVAVEREIASPEAVEEADGAIAEAVAYV